MKSKMRFAAIIVLAFLCSALPVYAADTVSVNASSYIRAIPETMYGTNMQTWDGAQNGSNANVNALIAAAGNRHVRWPGGSWANGHLWSDMEAPNYSNAWKVNYGESMYRINKFDSMMHR
jgi:alpha-L-arabinofuranosidase